MCAKSSVVIFDNYPIYELGGMSLVPLASGG